MSLYYKNENAIVTKTVYFQQNSCATKRTELRLLEVYIGTSKKSINFKSCQQKSKKKEEAFHEMVMGRAQWSAYH